MGKQLKNLSKRDEKHNKSANIQTILELQNCLNVLFNNKKIINLALKVVYFSTEIPVYFSVNVNKVPNLEIQKSLNALFFNYLTNLDRGYGAKRRQIIGSFLENDFNAFQQELKSLFAAIPYDNYVNNNISVYEGYYASVIFAFLSRLGF